MNIYRKYCPNVFVAQCTEAHKRGDIIEVETKHGKKHQCEVHNFILKNKEFFYYSIIRVDGFNAQERAKRKVEKLKKWQSSALTKSDEWYKKSNEGAEFLALGEPIKIGHHSEKRHRALIERNNIRMSNSMEELEKAKGYDHKIKYWEGKEEEINLSMPESLEFFKLELEKAKKYHKGLKDGSIKREHSFSLTYAKKKVNELEKKYKISKTLWEEKGGKNDNV